MSGTRHTRGPWKHDTNRETRRGVIHIESTRGHQIASVAVRPTAAEEAANAHLICAAPDLLAACIAMMEPYEGMEAEEFAPETCERIRQMRAAIAKAVGT